MPSSPARGNDKNKEENSRGEVVKDSRLCSYTDCSIAQLCKRSVLNTEPVGKDQPYLAEIEYDDDNKCTSFLPLHKTAEKLYRLATFPARVTKRVNVATLGDKRRGKALIYQ
jgi:hypothetical protein